MKFIDEFRQPETVRRLADQITETAARVDGAVRIMEVCGGHTMAIHRFGLPSLLPDNIELLSGPGCPVCVTPTTYVDRAIGLVAGDSVTLTTFGDLYRVSGSEETLEDAAGRGVDARVVYSPRDALKLASDNPDRTVIFLAVGFETTAPVVAASVQEAARRGIDNFRVMSGHKTMPPALRALVEAPEVALDGFLLPGHVSTIIGTEPYRFLAEEFNLACCVTGFEPADMLRGIASVVAQRADERSEVDNEYRRVVNRQGNPTAGGIVADIFEPADSQWRGLGMIPDSGLTVRSEWQDFSIDPPDPTIPSKCNSACRCDEVLRGLAKPPDCELFGKACTPDSAVGPCMVSSEGACAAYYKYGTGKANLE